MGIGFREHVASLLAVFLALALGVLVGVSLSRQEPLEQRMESLSQQFQQLSAENAALRGKVEELQRHLRARGEFDGLTLEGLVKGRLTGMPVALILVGDLEGVRFEQDLSGTLTLAGAHVVGNLAIGEDFATRVGQAEDTYILGEQASQPGAAARIFARIGAVVGTGQWFLLQSLAQMGLASLSGDLSAKPTAVLIITSLPETGRDEMTRLLPRLVEALRENGQFVVATEPTTAALSTVPVYRRTGVTTVDNIDTIPGQVAVVLALAARAEGAFGVKESAQALLPKL